MAENNVKASVFVCLFVFRSISLEISHKVKLEWFLECLTSTDPSSFKFNDPCLKAVMKVQNVVLLDGQKMLEICQRILAVAHMVAFPLEFNECPL